MHQARYEKEKDYLKPPDNKPKILFFDIETTPNLAWIWRKYEQNALAFEQVTYLLSWSAKWLGGSQITKGLIDYKGYNKDRTNDFALVSELWALLDEADVVVAHNGKSFDVKIVNARFSFWGLSPPKPYKIVDTKTQSKTHFWFTSNSLNDIAEYLGLGTKLTHTGFSLWLKCMAGDKKAWALMLKYNAQDIILLEKVYKKLLPYMSNHPNLSSIKESMVCVRCGSRSLQSRGEVKTLGGVYKRYQCNGCGGWNRSAKRERGAQQMRSI